MLLTRNIFRCSGYLFKKVSKYAAATAVVGYLAVQVTCIVLPYNSIALQVENLFNFSPRCGRISATTCVTLLGCLDCISELARQNRTASL